MPALSKDQKILRATNTLMSHLFHWGYQPQVIHDSTYSTISVGTGQVRIGPGDNDVDTSQLRSARLEVLEKALNKACGSLGVPAQQIRYRTPKKAPAKLEGDFEDIIFRAKSFALAPNITQKEFSKWHPVLKQQTNSVYWKAKRVLNAFGYDYEDLYSIAQVHLVTALHRFVTGDPKEDNKIVGQYVKQRLIEVTTKIKRKAEKCVALPHQLDSCTITVH